jgi:hypothetical protein
MTAAGGRAASLGLEVAPDDLVLAREMVVDWYFRHDRVRVFELRLRAEPVIRIDNRGIVTARFVDPRALLAEAGLSPLIREERDAAVAASVGSHLAGAGASLSVPSASTTTVHERAR